MGLAAVIWRTLQRCEHCGKKATRRVFFDVAEQTDCYVCETCLLKQIQQVQGGVYLADNTRFSIWTAERPFSAENAIPYK